MNKILNKVIENRKGHYVHAIEVNNIYDIQNIIESLINEFKDEYTDLEYIEFFNTMEVYFMEDEEGTPEDNEQNETEVYNFNFHDYIFGTSIF